MKFLITTLIIFSSLWFLTSANLAFAQTPIQKAFEGVKEKLDDLVNAKDENNLTDLSLRIETFKKVIDLSVSEAKDLKVKLLAVDNMSDELGGWRDKMIGNLNQAVDHYNGQKEFLADNEKSIDLETIKSLAQSFKTWRDENYLATADEVRDFLLVGQEQKSIQVAKKRLQKITDDISWLQKSGLKGIAELQKLLNNASALISEGESLNKEADDEFMNRYVYLEPVESQLENSGPTGPVSEATSSTSTPASQPKDTETVEPINAATGSTSILESINQATSSTSTPPETSTSTEVFPPLSIKDLVRDSLGKLKEAYQVFIEMSNLVRELLK